MKSKVIRIIIICLLTIGITVLYEHITLNQVIDVKAFSQEEMIVLQKKSKEHIWDHVTSYVSPDYKLIRINETGEIIKDFVLPKDDAQTFSDYDNITVVGTDFYIHRMIKNPDNYFIFSEEVLKYSTESGNYKTIYHVDYEDGDTVEYALIEKLYYQNDSVYMIAFDNDDEDLWYISKLGIYTDEYTEVRELVIDEAINLSDLIYLADDSVVISSSDGKLYRYADSVISEIDYVGMPDEIRPEQLILVSDETIGFYDHLTEDFITLNTADNIFNVYRSGDGVIGNTVGLTYGKAVGMNLNSNNMLTGNIRLTKALKRYLFMDNGNEVLLIDDLNYDRNHYITHGFYVLVILILIYLVLHGLLILYRKRGGSLITKFLLILLPLVLVIPGISLSLNIKHFITLAQNDLYAELYNITEQHVAQMSSDAVTSINSVSDYQSPAYYQLEQQRLVSADNFNAEMLETYERWYYSVVYRIKDDTIYTLVGDDIDFWIDTAHIYGEKGNSAYEEVLQTGKIALGENSDPTGVWIFAVAPIKDSAGNLVGLYEVGTGQESYVFYILEHYGELALVVLSTVGFVLLLMGLIIYRMIQPLRQLNLSSKDILAGEWGTTVSFNTMDEVGQLADVFNRMSLFIKDYIDELTTLNQLYYKFIPLRYFELLQKEKISDIKKGDFTHQEMVMVYVNASKYFERAANEDSESQLAMLNALFEIYVNAIHQSSGLIGEFRNTGMVAVFKDVDDALDAATSIMQYSHMYYQDMQTTVAIHKGPVLMGIVGNEQRMNTTVISEAVNELTEIEKLAAKYKTGVILTGSARPESLKDVRYIGELKNSRTADKITLYEWLATIAVGSKHQYDLTQNEFENGLKAYEANSFETAKTHFVSVIKRNREDGLSKAYLYMCEEHLANSVSEYTPIIKRNI